MKILFVSRAFPPVLGGIENQNEALSVWLSQKTKVTTIANRHGKRFLPVFLPGVSLRILFTLPRYDVLLLGDGVLAPVGALIKLCFPRKTVVSVIHGLDLTFASQTSWLSRWYAFINLPSLRKLDGLIAVSEETRQLAIRFGMESSRVFVIPNGVDPSDLRQPADRQALSELLKSDLAGKKIIVRVGRFVRHKGVAWFIKNVVPILSNDIVFVAAGGVPQNAIPGDANIFPECQKLVDELHLEARVHLLKNISWAEVKLLLNTGDLAVAPNIPTPGSFEGFGIAAIEAGACALPMVASRLEGLQEAIHDGKNGFLVPAGDAKAFIEKIESLLSDDALRIRVGEQAAQYVSEHFHWNHITERYLDTLEDIKKSTTDSH